MKIATRSGLALSLFILLAFILLLAVNALTRDKIVKTQNEWQLQSVTQILPDLAFDEESFNAATLIKHPFLGGKDAQQVYQITSNQQLVATLFTLETTEGYNGNIKMIIGIDESGAILGVRVLDHKETPGLGDKIERDKSNWITSFNGLSLSNTTNIDWQVKKHGGLFDAFTGATITPNAVIKAVYNGLQWHNTQ